VTCDTLSPLPLSVDIFDSDTSEGEPRSCSVLVPEPRGIACWKRSYWTCVGPNELAHAAPCANHVVLQFLGARVLSLGSQCLGVATSM
jgi:hypothetical protein